MATQLAVLSCDDRGTPNPSSGSKTYALGGFASALDDQEELIRAWGRVKQELCGSEDIELKWSHFFPGHHQEARSNPLSADPSEWRDQALWALRELFQSSSAFPLSTIVQKDRMGPSILAKTPKGKDVIDAGQVFASTLGQFALYLKENDLSSGEIWFDNLGSRSEEDRFQENLNVFFDSLSEAAMPAHNIQLVRRIDPKIRFLNSASEPIIQLADFVSGVIWAASEGDTWFLERLLKNYAPGLRRTYGIVIIEA